jgi:hypothetical protein
MVQLIENNVMYILEDTLDDIRKALQYYRKERERHRAKAKKLYWARKPENPPASDPTPSPAS